MNERSVAQPEESAKERCYQELIQHLKEDINQFLWTRLGPYTTIETAETVACEIDKMIRDTWKV